MDINDLRVIITVVSFVTFLAILRWAFSSKNKQSFDEAALLPFTEDGPVEAGSVHAVKHERKAS